MEAFNKAIRKTDDGFRFTLAHIHPQLLKYPNVDASPYKERLEEWSRTATKHILTTMGAVTGALAAYAHEWDKSMNSQPDLAEAFNEGEEFHHLAQSKDIRENPDNTRYRTKPYTW